MQTSPAGTYPGTKLAGWLTTTDHKRIGALYLITSFSFFLLAGGLALISTPSWPGRVCSS
jgi:cytochrome c oxidase subunit 1